ncbi:MAG TPA: hypothetical protein VF153_09215 [Candidatus Limnocylindria bacterium]
MHVVNESSTQRWQRASVACTAGSIEFGGGRPQPSRGDSRDDCLPWLIGAIFVGLLKNVVDLLVALSFLALQLLIVFLREPAWS